MKSYPRIRRLNEVVREALAEILAEEMTDPRLELVTITGVAVSRDMRVADVFVTAHGDEERYRLALEGLESAKRRIRSELGRRVTMKYLPELRFLVDPSVDEGMNVSRAISDERPRSRDRTGGEEA